MQRMDAKWWLNPKYIKHRLNSGEWGEVVLSAKFNHSCRKWEYAILHRLGSNTFLLGMIVEAELRKYYQ